MVSSAFVFPPLFILGRAAFVEEEPSRPCVSTKISMSQAQYSHALSIYTVGQLPIENQDQRLLSSQVLHLPKRPCGRGVRDRQLSLDS